MQKENNTPYSKLVPHATTNGARRCLTSLSRREAVLSSWYGRSRCRWNFAIHITNFCYVTSAWNMSVCIVHAYNNCMYIYVNIFLFNFFDHEFFPKYSWYFLLFHFTFCVRVSTIIRFFVNQRCIVCCLLWKRTCFRHGIESFVWFATKTATKNIPKSVHTPGQNLYRDTPQFTGVHVRWRTSTGVTSVFWLTARREHCVPFQ